MAQADIYSIEWCDMIFLERNKTYGAFDLRKYSSERHLIALIVSSLLFISAIMTSRYLKETASGKRDVNTGIFKPTNIILSTPKNKVPDDIKSLASKQLELRKTVKFTPPVITKDDSVNEAEELKPQHELIQARGLIGTINNANGSENPNAPMPGPDKQITGEETGDKPFIVVQQQPEFPEGMKALYQYFNDNLKYPVRAKNNLIQGKVFVQFVVSKNGTIIDIKILKGVEESLDQEAIRLIAGMPEWKPGKINGKAVATYFSLPIKFMIQDH